MKCLKMDIPRKTFHIKVLDLFTHVFTLSDFGISSKGLFQYDLQIYHLYLTNEERTTF